MSALRKQREMGIRCRLLELPAELRLRIFELALDDSSQHSFLEKGARERNVNYGALTSTNKQIRHETLPIERARTRLVLQILEGQSLTDWWSFDRKNEKKDIPHYAHFAIEHADLPAVRFLLDLDAKNPQSFKLESQMLWFEGVDMVSLDALHVEIEEDVERARGMLRGLVTERCIDTKQLRLEPGELFEIVKILCEDLHEVRREGIPDQEIEEDEVADSRKSCGLKCSIM